MICFNSSAVLRDGIIHKLNRAKMDGGKKKKKKNASVRYLGNLFSLSDSSSLLNIGSMGGF